MYEDRESRHLNEKKKEPTDSISRHTIYLYGGAILVFGSGVHNVVFEVFGGCQTMWIEGLKRTYFSLSSMSLWFVSAEEASEDARCNGRGGEREAKTTY